MARIAADGGTTGSTLTVQVTETCSINSRDYGGYSTEEITGIKNVTKRIETITATEATIIAFDTAIGAGTYIPANVAYMRFTNLDDTNFVTLTFKNAADDEVAIKVDAGKSFMMVGDNSGGIAAMFNAVAGDAASDTALGNLKDVQADANTGNVDIEIYIACTA